MSTKNKIQLCAVHKTGFSFNGTHTLKVKKWEKIFQVNRNQNREEERHGYIFIRQNRLKSKTVTRQGKLLYNCRRVSVSIKHSNLNTFSHTNRAPIYKVYINRNQEQNRQQCNNTRRLQYSSTMDQSYRQKINKKTTDFNNAIDQMNETDIRNIQHSIQ